MTCGYSRREIPTKQAVNDAAPEETGSTKDRDRSTCAQRVHQRSLTKITQVLVCPGVRIGCRVNASGAL